MTHRKQIKRLEELMNAVQDVQRDMANEGIIFEDYDKVISGLQKRYNKLTGNYIQHTPPYAVKTNGDGK